MKHIGQKLRRYALLLALALLAEGTISAQDGAELDSAASAAMVQVRLRQFIDELYVLARTGGMHITLSSHAPISASYIKDYHEKALKAERTLSSIQSRWTTYSMAQQYEIAASDSLMNIVADLDLVKQAAADSVKAWRQACQSLDNFREAELFLNNQDTVYKNLYKKAFRLSLVSKAAPLLERMKAKETLLFGKVQSSYDQAKAAVETVPALSGRMTAIDEQYIGLKAMSEKIQTLEYKPFLVRIKDYLLGFAAVAIILLVLNLFITKVRALNKARKSVQQYKNMLKNNGDNYYPTI
jgi:hypothetical protein